MICRVLGFTEQGYYKWLRNPVSERDKRDFELVKLIIAVHEEHPAAGYRSIYDYLIAQGVDVTEYKVHALCHEYQIFSSRKKRSMKKYHDSKTDCEDLVNRQFVSPEPNILWLVDITEHKTNEGKLYVCAIKDCFSRMIVGYSMDGNMRDDLLCNAVSDALYKRGYPTGTIIHSDRGGQMRSKKYKELLKKHGLIRSMGNARTCADNAAMESFFSRLQECVFNSRKVWNTRRELRLETAKWINHDYNKVLRNRTMKMTPFQMEETFNNGEYAKNDDKNIQTIMIKSFLCVILKLGTAPNKKLTKLF